MNDLAKFIGWMVIIAPCFLIVDEGKSWWPNIFGIVYFFFLCAWAMSHQGLLNRWLDAMERFEERVLKGR